jgi:protein-arginine kinase activator protein McsA
MNDFVFTIDEMVFFLSKSLAKQSRNKEEVFEVFEKSNLNVYELKICLESSVNQELYEVSAIIRDVINIKENDTEDIARRL